MSYDWPCIHRGEPTGASFNCGSALGAQPVFACNLPALNGVPCVLSMCQKRAHAVHGRLNSCAGCNFRETPEKQKRQQRPVPPPAAVVDAPRAIKRHKFEPPKKGGPPRSLCMATWTRRIDLSAWPELGRTFNCSLLRRGEETFLVFRAGQRSNEIHIAELRDWQVVGVPKRIVIPLVKENQYGGGWTEDPRVVLHDGRVFISYVGAESIGPWRSSICLAELDDAFLVRDQIVPRYEYKQKVEKNWSWFSSGGELHCVYLTAPEHRVLTLRDGRMHERAFVRWSPKWDAGELRGGASPVLHNGQWYSFIHGNAPGRRYSVGLYTFSASAPFAPKRWIPAPILTPNLDERQPGLAAAVFPCGAIYDAASDLWLVSYGYLDHWCYVAAFRGADLERSLIDVP